MLSRTGVVTACLVAVGVVGCGGSSGGSGSNSSSGAGGDQAQAAATLKRYVVDAANGDGAAACALFTPQRLKQIESQTGGKCAAAIKALGQRATSQDRQQARNITTTATVHGNTAVASFTNPTTHKVRRFSMQKIGGMWKIAGGA